jgi:hypothetical protein
MWTEWPDGTRQDNLRYRILMLDAGTVGISAVASAIGASLAYQASGKVNAQELALPSMTVSGSPASGT